MDPLTLMRIDEELDSSELAALCFLCGDVLNRKYLETINDGKELFIRLEEKGLLDNSRFLSQLLETISRSDLLRLLEADSRRRERSGEPQTDASPLLSDYRVMLYRIYEDLTKENLEKMKFLLNSKLGKRQLEQCTTALDVFAEMERARLLSSSKLDELQRILVECDCHLKLMVQKYMRDSSVSQYQHIHPIRNPDLLPRSTSHVINRQRDSNSTESLLLNLAISETQLPSEPSLEPREGQSLYSDADVSPPLQNWDYYSLVHNPRGTCLVINNEQFTGEGLRDRAGTQEDEKALRDVFGRLGFKVDVRNDLTADAIRNALDELGKRNFIEADALVVCVLSHGEKECVFGTDGQKVALRELTRPFTSERAATLAGKPKLFFIQACQGSGYQRGSMPCPPKPLGGEAAGRPSLEEDAGPVQSELVPSDADFLIGMATVGDCKSFRNTSTGSIYIQALCKQLLKSAFRNDDILTTLTFVNGEVSRGEYMNFKQMPEPKYTLTKKLVLTLV